MEAGQLNILEILWHSGLVVKAVLIILVLASIISWAIIFKKRKFLKDVDESNKKFLDLYQMSPSLKEVKEQCISLPFSPYKSLFENGYDELMKMSDTFDEKGKKVLGLHFKNFGLSILERALKKGSNESNKFLEQHLSILASIGSVTPFVGLFGTVWGIIDSFTGLASGGGTLDAVAPGIAEALVATAIGLAAAIPAVWFYNYYLSRNTQINADMENFSEDFLNTVERTLVER